MLVRDNGFSLQNQPDQLDERQSVVAEDAQRGFGMAAVLRFWTACSHVPLRAILAGRYLVGKEDARSIAERWFTSPPPRPASWRGKRVVWFHAASLGESVSVIPLLRAVLDQSADRRALVTTSTITARRWLADALSAGRLAGVRSEHVVVSLAPSDARMPVARFLSAWAPECGILVESELWPALLHSCALQNIPLALVSARLSARSFGLWSSPVARVVAQALLGCFRVVVPQCAEQGRRFGLLGGRMPDGLAANLKWCDPGIRPPPAHLEAAFADRVLAGRPAWVALSTHDGEDAQIASAHAAALAQAKARPGARPLLVVVPRHANDAGRVSRVLAAYRAAGLAVSLHSDFERAAADAGSGAAGQAEWAAGEARAAPQPHAADVHVCDSIGQVQLFLRACPLVLVCGSMVEGPGGHNLLEPMRARCAVLLGPHAPNVASTLEAAERCSGDARAVEQLRGVDDLISALRLLHPECEAELERRRSAARAAAALLEARQLATTLEALHEVLPPADRRRS